MSSIPRHLADKRDVDPVEIYPLRLAQGKTFTGQYSATVPTNSSINLHLIIPETIGLDGQFLWNIKGSGTGTVVENATVTTNPSNVITINNRNRYLNYPSNITAVHSVTDITGGTTLKTVLIGSSSSVPSGQIRSGGESRSLAEWGLKPGGEYTIILTNNDTIALTGIVGISFSELKIGEVYL